MPDNPHQQALTGLPTEYRSTALRLPTLRGLCARKAARLNGRSGSHG
jgi:hypothetical protein